MKNLNEFKLDQESYCDLCIIDCKESFTQFQGSENK